MKLAIRILLVVAALVSCGNLLAQENGIRTGKATAPPTVKIPAARDAANKPEAVAAIDITQDKAETTNTFKATSVKGIEKVAPVLTTEQKQAIQIIAQKIEIAQLRAQAAQAEFDKARTEIGVLVQTLQKEGFDLDLQTLTYTPKKVEPKK